MNRTILERVRCMFLSLAVPKKFWGEAVITAAKVLNKCPSSAIDFLIPDEKWYGEKPDFCTLKPFGCRVYAQVKRSKLETRAVKCIFLEYQDGVKGFRLVSGISQKLVDSRAVVFDETRMPYTEKEKSKEGADLEVELTNQQNGEYQHNTDTGQGVSGTPTNRRHDVQADDTQEAESYKLARDRPRRNVKLPERYNDYEMVFYALCVADDILFDEPATFQEAMRSIEKSQWIKAMEEEIESLLRKGTWILVDRSLLQRAVGCKWIFRKKVEVTGKSSLQSVVALSTTEAEYIALTEAIKEGVWLRGIIGDFGVSEQTVTILCDSNSAICLALVFHERSKHIDVRLHLIRDIIERGEVEVQKVGTENNADALTEALPVSKVKHCLKLVGVVGCQGGVMMMEGATRSFQVQGGDC